MDTKLFYRQFIQEYTNNLSINEYKLLFSMDLFKLLRQIFSINQQELFLNEFII